ncbi:glycosyltransferase family 2 protein [Ureibacillus aquaedulcis]|uniref:Glycosyltransferase n=1 Tax=Ureibacillus aquaedulcis TaxID=3058421 RepID=A0ABT8GN29_9BACL|nr:glycosyltransferase [Ureibacillus sp. BA0131]MDN4492691.1 glycosyltransferase [Ureibacillus sp. BA0131]
MDWIIDALMQFFGKFIIIYVFFAILVYGAMLFLAVGHIRKQYSIKKMRIEEEYMDSFQTKPVSILVPAFNEELGIINSVHSLLSLQYPDKEIIVINDGSTDDTEGQLIRYFQMKQVEKIFKESISTKPIKSIYQSTIHPSLWLINKENGGKADSLNAGINVTRYPYFCSIDGDSLLEPSALQRVMRPIVQSDGKVIAAGGNIRIANGLHISMGSIVKMSVSDRPLVVMQIVEYLRAFLMGRIAFSRLNIMLIISGAFSVFSKEWAIKVGGYSVNTIGEDMEIVVKLHRKIREEKANKRIEFVPEPVCWTEVPQSIEVLRSQRRRWHQGLIESLWKHRSMTLNPKYGAIGMISFPYFWLIECLGPVIELGGLIYIGFSLLFSEVHTDFAILALLLFIFYGAILSVMTLLLEAWSMKRYPPVRDMMRIAALSMTELFWYRPMTLFWRCEGIYRFMRRKSEWGRMKRIGISDKESS